MALAAKTSATAAFTARGRSASLASRADFATAALPRLATCLDALPWRQRELLVLPVLHGRVGGPGGGVEAANVIRARAPRQVLVELCARRYADALGSAVLNLRADPPPRLDILANIHGGLLKHELVPVLAAAREVGAAVVPIDRPGSATRSRAAQRLWHPKLLQGLLRYGAHSLRRRAAAALPGEAEALRAELERCCPAAHEVLVSERCSYMAHQRSTYRLVWSSTFSFLFLQ
eukprot:TRINITY_DN20058_c0_g1_i2.p1 TRINITY_DN20058_c0_g1~~TRINITY_DN20058_c0_g1_i2.p1  ORF type:complete len:254 (-),score=26.46 TRINITY_DN20058_c0_g1_i2:137-835(-)